MKDNYLTDEQLAKRKIINDEDIQAGRVFSCEEVIEQLQKRRAKYHTS